MEQKIKDINEEISEIPLNDLNTKSEIQKIMFLGELKTKLSFYEKQWDEAVDGEEIQKDLMKKKDLLSELQDRIIDYSSQIEYVLNLLDEIIQTYLEQTQDAIPTYKGYKSAFQYKTKSLMLKAPKALLPNKVGSSSNHLFLHFCLFLGLQELIIRQKSPYVPYWLILDQPSRPYFGEESKTDHKKEWNEVINSDRTKITMAMRLLNDFITYINEELEMDFQIIVLEHIPKIFGKKLIFKISIWLTKSSKMEMRL